MTHDPNDPTLRAADKDYRTTSSDYGSRPIARSASNTGVIGAIVGVLAIIAIVFFVWRGSDDTTGNMTTSSSPGMSAPTKSVPAAPSTGTAAVPPPAGPASPAVPASPDTTGTTTTAPRP